MIQSEIIKNRISVGNLILKVVINKVPVSNAIALFPKKISDINIKCAFDALVHYEADEDFRRKSSEYAQVQDEYLLSIARTLRDGNSLPKNIIIEYNKFYKDVLISPKETFFTSFTKSIKRMINF